MAHENNLQKLGKKSLTASDISAQFWCERQMELNAMHGSRRTWAMKKGASIHKVMQDEVYEELKAEPMNYADRLYKEAYENCLNISRLKAEGVCREIKIYGSINGYTIVGKIDELRLVDGKIMIVEDKTTKHAEDISEEKMRPNKVQIELYRKLLGDAVDGSYSYANFSSTYRIEGMQLSEEFKDSLIDQGVGQDMTGLRAIWNRFFDLLKTFSGMSDNMEINYRSRQTGDLLVKVNMVYSKQRPDKEMIHARGYWNGERESLPGVEEEKWKCKMCQFFGNRCTVWVNKL